MFIGLDDQAKQFGLCERFSGHLAGEFSTKDHIVKSAGNLLFLQLLRLQSKMLIAISA